MLGRIIIRALLGEAFSPIAIKDVVSRTGWQGLETHTDLKEVTHAERPNRFAELEIYPGIARHRY
jgi:hypothetical protein